jgi:murein DD-endopeptidase MepM/ murein hydrolase activator NlpD
MSLTLATATRAVELEGTWYVLVHYQDKESNKPEAWRWEDRVWSFARKGDRLAWNEWPIVQFNDDTGRFEAMRGGRAARVIDAWEPNPAQLADIQDGLAVNSRGEKTKTLRAGTGGTNWSSGEAAAADSATVITYSETWTIAGLPEAPIFTRDDSMGSASSETLEGRTAYRAESVGANGDEIKGSFDRDGSRTGRFRMIRTAAAHGLTGAAKSQQELQRKAGVRALTNSDEMRQIVRDRIEESFAESGVTLSDAALDAIVLEAVQAMARGESPDQIAPRLVRAAETEYFAFAKPGARHDESARYQFPFDPSTPRRLMQGVGGGVAIGMTGSVTTNRFSHKDPFQYAFDFEMPAGTPVVAARAGSVVRVVDHFTEGGPSKSLASRANVVVVLHDDGSFASYVHLSPQATVKPGQRVAVGDVLGKSGNTGYTTEPQLHFDVQRIDETGVRESVNIRFDDGSAAGTVPVTGSYYGGGARSRATP